MAYFPTNRMWSSGVLCFVCFSYMCLFLFSFFWRIYYDLSFLPSFSLCHHLFYIQFCSLPAPPPRLIVFYLNGIVAG